MRLRVTWFEARNFDEAGLRELQFIEGDFSDSRVAMRVAALVAGLPMPVALGIEFDRYEGEDQVFLGSLGGRQVRFLVTKC